MEAGQNGPSGQTVRLPVGKANKGAQGPAPTLPHTTLVCPVRESNSSQSRAVILALVSS